MKFDKDLFIKYLKEEKNNNNDDYIFLYRLYNNYDIIEKIKAKDSNGLQRISNAEDSIYTIDGVVLDDKKRIECELYSILDFLEEKKLDNQEINEVLNIIQEIKTLDLNQPAIVFYAKKLISLVQVKLGLKPTFFLAAHKLFLEKYMNLVFNNENENINIYNLESKEKNKR